MSTVLDPIWRSRLAETLRVHPAERPEGGALRIVALGDRAASLLEAAMAEPVATKGDVQMPASASTTPRMEHFPNLQACVSAKADQRAADVALMSLDGVGEGAPAQAAGVSSRALNTALGQACRLYPARLLLIVLDEEALAPEALFAFGFRRLVAGTDAVMYEYRLSEYKRPPDWLNARFWANPERFALDDPEPDDDPDDEDDEELGGDQQQPGGTSGAGRMR